MAKIPDFSKFDFQGIVNSVKSIINPELTPPNVTPGDPIGAKIVQISNLLQKTADAHAQSAKDLTEIHNLLNSLYTDLETFRKIRAETVEVGEPSAEKVAPVEPKNTQTTTTATSSSAGATSGPKQKL
jgi:hypothetical protein